MIEDAQNEKFISIVSLWEIEIKVSLGKMSLMTTFDDLFPHQLNINGFTLLPIQVEHVSALSTLPFHHRDPFDRLIIAQAIVEKMEILSVDEDYDDYSVTRIW